MLVSFVDDRAVNFRRDQLRILAIEIVQPQLIEIRSHRCLSCNRLARFSRGAGPQNICETHRRGRCAILCAEAVTGGVDICSRQLASSGGFTQFGELEPISAHRKDCPNSVVLIAEKLMAKVVFRLIGYARGSALDHSEMPMRVDNQRHNRLAVHIESFGAGGCVRLVSCNRLNSIAFNNYCLIWLRRSTGAIYHVYIL